MTALEVPIPGAHLCRGQGKAELFLMSAEGLFDARALGNVGGNTADRVGYAGVIAQREFDRDVGMRPIRMGCHFFIFHRTVLLDHDHVIRAKGIRGLAGKDFMIGMADNLIGGQVEDLFKASIDEEIDRKSTRLNSSHGGISRMPSSA